MESQPKEAALVEAQAADITSPLSNVESTTTTREQAASDADPSLPQNWSRTRKGLIVAAISGMAFVATFSTLICAPSSLDITRDLHSYSGFASVFYITVFDIGEVLGPLLIGPASERFGRLKVYHLCNVLFIAISIVTGFSSSMGMLIAFRFLAGVSTAAICLNPTIVGDMFPVEKRGAAMSVMEISPLMGPILGPIVGGYVTEGWGWRWTFWVTAIVAVAMEGLLLCVLRESYLPYIRRNSLKAQAAAETQPSEKPSKPLFARCQELSRVALRPFAIMLGSATATLLAVYLTVLTGYLYLLVSTLGTIFQGYYGFSLGASGLAYAGITVGMVSAALLCRFTLDRVLGAAGTPSKRLIPALPGALLLPAGMLIYGWTLAARAPWPAPILGTALAGFAVSATKLPVVAYLVDVFGERAASVLGAVLPLRNLGAALLPIAGPYLYDRLGYGWGNTLLACVALLGVPVPVWVVWRGRRGTRRCGQ